MPMIYDEQSGEFFPVPVGAAEMWKSGAAEMWGTGGPFQNLLARMKGSRDDRRAAKAERLVPDGYSVVETASINELIAELEKYKKGLGVPPSLAGSINRSLPPGLQAAGLASIGGGLGLTISAAAAFAGDQASTPDSATSSYTFDARRVRINVVGAAGFGVRFTAITIAQVQMINGSGYVVGPDQPELVIPLATPVNVPVGVAVVVTRAGGTGINAATGNYVLTIEP